MFEREIKAFDGKSTIESADKYEVHACVSCFGNRDHADDVMVKGSFERTLAEGKAKGKLPPGVAHHDWTLPVAKTLDAWEEDDGLHVHARFNDETQRGREMFSDIKAGIITEYSFGFKTVGQEQKDDGSRHVTDVDLYEWSPVLVGCNPDTYTAWVKSLQGSLIPPAGMSMEQHSSQVLATVEEFMSRVRSLKDLREKDGRTLSATRRDEIKRLYDTLGELLTETEPLADPVKAAHLHAQFQHTIARLNGALV